MPKRRPCVCKRCDRTEAEVGRISVRGLCAECANTRMLENTRQIIEREGPFYDSFVAGFQEAGYRLAAARRSKSPE